MTNLKHIWSFSSYLAGFILTIQTDSFGIYIYLPAWAWHLSLIEYEIKKKKMEANKNISWVLNFKISWSHIICVEVEGKNEMLHISYTNTLLHYMCNVCVYFLHYLLPNLLRYIKCKSNFWMKIIEWKLYMDCLNKTF